MACTRRPTRRSSTTRLELDELLLDAAPELDDALELDELLLDAAPEVDELLLDDTPPPMPALDEEEDAPPPMPELDEDDAPPVPVPELDEPDEEDAPPEPMSPGGELGVHPEAAMQTVSESSLADHRSRSVAPEAPSPCSTRGSTWLRMAGWAFRGAWERSKIMPGLSSGPQRKSMATVRRGRARQRRKQIVV